MRDPSLTPADKSCVLFDTPVASSDKRIAWLKAGLVKTINHHNSVWLYQTDETRRQKQLTGSKVPRSIDGVFLTVSERQYDDLYAHAINTLAIPAWISKGYFNFLSNKGKFDTFSPRSSWSGLHTIAITREDRADNGCLRQVRDGTPSPPDHVRLDP